MHKTATKILSTPSRFFERIRTTRWPDYPLGKARSGLIKRLDKEVERITIFAKANYERLKPQSGLVKAGAKQSRTASVRDKSRWHSRLRSDQPRVPASA
jgi:hypothetical protein